MDDLDNPVDVLPEHSPDKQTGAAADADDEPSGKPAANAAGALPASSSAADASKASADTAMPTPIAGKAMQQLVKSLPMCSFPKGMLLSLSHQITILLACCIYGPQSEARISIPSTVCQHWQRGMRLLSRVGSLLLLKAEYSTRHASACRHLRRSRREHPPPQLQQGRPRPLGGPLRQRLLSWRPLRQLWLQPAGRSSVMTNPSKQVR